MKQIEKRFCAYYRVSTKRQGKSQLGLEAQKEICRRFCEEHHGAIEAEFEDIESGKNRQRQGLWNALEYCRKENVALVIAKLDRLARDVEFTFKVINTGIEIHFCDMPMVNTMILGVFASVAQYERELISARTCSALEAKRTRGEQTGGTRELWGKNTHRDRSQAIKDASTAAARQRSSQAASNTHNRAFAIFIEDWQSIHGCINESTDWDAMVLTLNKRGLKTARGMEFTRTRAMAMYDKLKNWTI